MKPILLIAIIVLLSGCALGRTQTYDEIMAEAAATQMENRYRGDIERAEAWQRAQDARSRAYVGEESPRVIYVPYGSRRDIYTDVAVFEWHTRQR